MSLQNVIPDTAFGARMERVVRDGCVTFGLSIGAQLGLFEVIVSLKQPFTSEQLAQASDCKPSFVHQWLLLMAASDVVEVTDEEGRLFSLPPERHYALTSPLGAVSSSAMFTTIYSSKATELAARFKQDGPDDAIDMTEIYELWMSTRTKSLGAIIPPTLAQIPGLTDILRSGATVLDVGCNEGHLVFLLAELFPSSTFIGVDPNVKGVERANSKVPEGAKVTFEVQDALDLPSAWDDKFDFVITVNSLHHFADPVKGTSEINRVLKPGGYLSALEIYVDSNVPRMVKRPGALSYLCFEMIVKGKHSHPGKFDHDKGKGHHDKHGEGHGHHGKHGEGHGHHHEGHGHHHEGHGHHHEGHGHHHGGHGHHGKGHGEHGEIHSHDHDHHGPTDYQSLTKAIQDGGFKDVKMEECPKADFMEMVHLYAQKQ